MNKKPIYLVLPILCFLTSSLTAYNVLMGTIKFPRSISSVPNVRIYHSGKIIKGSIDESNKTITFSVPKYNNSQIRYTLAVTESIEFAKNAKAHDENIIDYIKVPHGQDYKLYTLLLVPRFGNALESGGPTYHWKVLDDRVRLDNKIPDDAIIVICDPQWVDGVKGENGHELPTINIKSDIISVAGSEHKVHEKSVQLLLAAIDSDTMHDATSNDKIKQDQNRVTIAAPVA